MSRKYLSVETLVQRSVDFEQDADPEYLLIKKWVSEPEQDLLWEHTRLLRERRRLDYSRLPRQEPGQRYEDDSAALDEAMERQKAQTPAEWGRSSSPEFLIKLKRHPSESSKSESLNKNKNVSISYFCFNR
ncbi:hypothetical protein DL98DRAFT_66400 [Cadophora sp. DSE1049]|nr:hypothetical protein DL98DRAFT_66400 [Cadophora sp. DSE1049]